MRMLLRRVVVMSTAVIATFALAGAQPGRRVELEMMWQPPAPSTVNVEPTDDAESPCQIWADEVDQLWPEEYQNWTPVPVQGDC